ncbi:helix-turn-helix domain-containing protein [Pseudoalteromonas umbrosa]|uniref:helix-turn-helix domain-containing protein n=1 Tax=Pseudoalteromonas umbrosa TaxID=3048489 RepID=UPI0024C306AB|nr:helix-turn-helix transcriptional regulator [Pseudoalteromonas sp. B95]MDK1286509.1 helix-turn-helix transcriptional regulator [Pseudoalteromonas sp. B95]
MFELVSDVIRNFYILSLVLGCIVCLLLFLSKTKTLACSLLGIWILLFVTELTQVALVMMDIMAYNSFISFDALYGLVFYFYVRFQIEAKKVSFEDIFHALPICASYLFSMTWDFCFGVVCALSYAVYIVHYLNVHRPKLKIEVTNQQYDNFTWLVAMARFQLICWCLVLLLLSVNDIFSVPVSKLIALASYVPMSFWLFYLSYFNQIKPLYVQGNVYKFSESHENAQVHKNHCKSYEHIIHRLNSSMRSDKLFLNPQLSISELAKHIDSTTAEVSCTLNTHLNMNFYDFVNRYRVDEAKLLLCKTQHKVLSVAFDAGFNSKSTFNKLFKSYTGLTPSQFRKEACGLFHDDSQGAVRSLNHFLVE